ncbi:MAG: TerB family tellurite resistance protein [Bacteroidia bacterium]|nr:TerB family tellurite resistance protein [Bacteroidia bacterium]
MMYNEKFYQAIGHAFYAVAHADKKVNKEELQTLIKIVRDQWAPLEEQTDEFGEDIAFQIISVFDWLSENEEKEKEALKHFKDYVMEHPKLFNSKIKQHILKTCEKIADVSHGTSKKEHKVIHEIEKILSAN